VIVFNCECHTYEQVIALFCQYIPGMNSTKALSWHGRSTMMGKPSCSWVRWHKQKRSPQNWREGDFEWPCNEAPRSSLLRRSSYFGYEGRKLQGIRRRRIIAAWLLLVFFLAALAGRDFDFLFELAFDFEKAERDLAFASARFAGATSHVCVLLEQALQAQSSCRDSPDPPFTGFPSAS